MWGEAPESVLVIQTAFIGDVILTIPLLKEVKNRWPDAALDFIVRPPANNLVETLHDIRHLYVFDKYGRDRGASGFLRMRKQLHGLKYDLALIPHRSFRSGFLAYLSGIPIRVGFKRGGGRFFHSHSVAYPVGTHEILRNLTLLGPFGAPSSVSMPEVVPTEQDVKLIDQKVSGYTGRTLLALAPGSVWFTKRWPEEHYVVLAQKCASEGFLIILIGGQDDRDLCSRIADKVGEKCMNLAGETTLRQTVELLRRCALLITNDSAPTHLGTAAEIRVLTLFGSTTPEFGFAPYGPKGRVLEIELYCRPCTDHGRRSCPEKHFRCLKEITPARVFQELKAMPAEIQP